MISWRKSGPIKVCGCTTLERYVRDRVASGTAAVGNTHSTTKLLKSGSSMNVTVRRRSCCNLLEWRDREELILETQPGTASCEFKLTRALPDRSRSRRAGATRSPPAWSRTRDSRRQTAKSANRHPPSSTIPSFTCGRRSTKTTLRDLRRTFAVERRSKCRSSSSAVGTIGSAWHRRLSTYHGGARAARRHVPCDVRQGASSTKKRSRSSRTTCASRSTRPRPASTSCGCSRRARNDDTDKLCAIVRRSRSYVDDRLLLMSRRRRCAARRQTAPHFVLVSRRN
jgi:hypothetical protein